MEKSEIKGFIAKRCAKELKNGDVVNLGIGLPTLIPNYLPKDVELIIHAELGIVSAGATPKEGDANYDPYHVIDAGGGVASVAYGGGFIDSATNFGLIRGGHVDACFLGALEVDAQGNLANWIIPGKKMPGMGGAMDLCVGAKHCIVCMEHTAKGNPKICLLYTSIRSIPSARWRSPAPRSWSTPTMRTPTPCTRTPTPPPPV